LTPEEAVTIVNAYGDLLEQLDRENQERWKYCDRDQYKEEILKSPDPLSVGRNRYDPVLLPYSKETIQEAMVLLIGHPDVEEVMKSRLRVGLLTLDDFVEIRDQ
jgi:hypothetical protein